MDKLARLSDHLDRQLEACKNDLVKMYILSRDQAYFLTLFFSGDRPGDLGQVQTNEILRFPNDDGLLFNRMRTHREKHFMETDRIFLELEDVQMSKFVQ